MNYAAIALLAAAWGGLTACQHTEHAAAAAPPAKPAAVASPGRAAAPASVTVPRPDSAGAAGVWFRPLSAVATDSLWQRYDLGNVWRRRQTSPAQNGFFGPDHYRIEMVFLEVTRDSARAHIYHVRGKSRLKGVITPFAGFLTFTRASQYVETSSEDAAVLFASQGSFVLEEAPGAHSGRFAGTFALDFHVNDGQAELEDGLGGGTAARDAGFLCEGQWTSYRTGASKPVLWAADVLTVADEVLRDFKLGERDVTINPKYAKLGWSNYWENDEWWTEAPAKTL